jgi:LDH2 family malate/lactate/ureidoglycolate dehydrogenase
MIDVNWAELKRFLPNLLIAAGMSSDNAAIMADVYLRATARGIGHHDLYDLPGRLKGLYEKRMNPNPDIRLLSQFNAMESYRGDHGPGELCAAFITRRAMVLADAYGIGLCTICDSNHYLASAPYIEMAAEAGYLAMMWTKGSPTLGAPGRTEKVISSAPMGYAAATDEGYNLVHDFCAAYASYGTLQQKSTRGESVPDYWGVDKTGQPTTDPTKLNAGTVAPIGGHKGFGLAILAEILTGVLSQGQVIDEPHPVTGETGVASQTVIVIKPGALMPEAQFSARTSEMIRRMETSAPGLRLPGQRSAKNRRTIKTENKISLEEPLVSSLNEWASKLNCTSLIDSK